jgi:glc operon protein GlcG
MRNKLCMSTVEVQAIVAACKAKAEELGQQGTIAVVDEDGDLLYLERPDNQGPHTVLMAMGKARTAAVRARSTASLEDRIKERPGYITYPEALAVRGGVPVFYEGACVGGVAVSGISNDDEVVAQAGADAVG